MTSRPQSRTFCGASPIPTSITSAILPRLEVLEANIERDRTLLEIAENQLEAGVATPIDVTRAEVQLAQNEIAKLQQQTRVVDTELRIKRILNLPLNTNLRVTETLDLYADRRFCRPLLRGGGGTRHASKQSCATARSIVASASPLSAMNSPAAPLVGSASRPSKSGADWGYVSSSITGSMREQWRVQAALSFPLFRRVSYPSQPAPSHVRRAPTVPHRGGF